MSREDIARLLGGYATGTLSPEEQQALFAAALEDQALFDELAREQALRDVLREPAARAQLLAALEDRPRWYRRFGSWTMRPAALAAAAACLLVLGSVAVWRPWRGGEAPKPAVVATALAPRQAPAIPTPATGAERKAQAPPAVGAVAKARTPAPAHAMPAAVMPVTPEAKKELLLAESAAAVTVARSASEPAAPAGAAMPPPASPPPPPPALQSASQQVTVDTALAGRDAAELMKIVPGAGTVGPGKPGGAAAGSAGAPGAFSATRMQPTAAVAASSGGGARQRYYAGTAPAGLKAQAEAKSVRAAVRAPGSQPAPLGIKWSILRREADGEFAVVNAEDLRAGDTVKLRLASNQDCDLSVFDNANGKLLPLFTKHVQAGETVDTLPLASREKGLRELSVLLTQGGDVFGAVATRQPALPREGQQSETDRSEQATYTVGAAGAQQVFLSIALNYR